MAAPKLSTTTLSLKFMQRNRNNAQVELEQAKVKDDAEWEVSQEVRDSWGLASTSEPGQTVSYESSYLPFLFPSLPDPSPSSSTDQVEAPQQQLRGRRLFDKHGREPALEAPKEVKTGTPAHDWTNDGMQPSSISGSKGSTKMREGKGHQDKPRTGAPSRGGAKPGSSAKKSAVLTMIDEPAPPPAMAASLPKPAAPKGFMKPSGVDAPVHKPSKAPKSPVSQIVQGARAKGKRVRTESSEGDVKKAKKKRPSTD